MIVKLIEELIKCLYRCCAISQMNKVYCVYVPGIHVKVPIVNVCRTVIRVDNSSGMLSNVAFSSKGKFIKSASTYFNNDDNKLETLKEKERIE